MTWEQMRVNWATSPVRSQVTRALEQAVCGALAAIVPMLPESVRQAAARAAVAVVEEAINQPVKVETGGIIITDHRG